MAITNPAASALDWLSGATRGLTGGASGGGGGGGGGGAWGSSFSAPASSGTSGFAPQRSSAIPGLGRNPYIDPASQGQVQGISTGGGGFMGAATGAASAVNNEAAQAAGVRSEIIARRERANSIFEALTGAVSALAQEKRGQLESQFGQEQQKATEDFTARSGELARLYRARGIGDSSYKVNAMDKAGKDYDTAIRDLGMQRGAGLAKIGSEAEGFLARGRADKAAIGGINLDEVGRRPDGTFDVNALIELRNNLDERIREGEVQLAGAGTEAGFRGKLNQIAPYGGTVDALKGALSSLVQSAAPKVTKDRLAAAIIGNYAPEDGQVWQNFYEEQSRKAGAANVA